MPVRLLEEVVNRATKAKKIAYTAAMSSTVAGFRH